MTALSLLLVAVCGLFLVIAGIIIYGYVYKSRWVGVSGRTFYEWLNLLVVPFFVAISVAGIGFWFTWRLEQTQQEVEDQRIEVQQELEDHRLRIEQRREEKRTQSEQELEARRSQSAGLQAYYSQIGQLMLEKDLRESAGGSEVRTLARALTLTVLGTLNSDRKGSVLRFLNEAQLMSKTEPVVSLEGAPLQQLQLFRIVLSDANLSGANLQAADMSGNDLEGVNLAQSDLRNAALNDTNLEDATLTGALLGEARLDNARLVGADLNYTDMTGTDLRGANLSGANLKGAEVTQQQLDDSKSLEDAIMPSGSKHN